MKEIKSSCYLKNLYSFGQYSTLFSWLSICMFNMLFIEHGDIGKKTPPQNSAEAPITFTNPSFEDKPRQSASPAGWGSQTGGSTPDIQPGIWGVTLAPHSGKTYVGLVTREDGTSEDIGQTLREALASGKCYRFSIFLAHSKQYAGYNHPVRLRVWGGSKKGSKEQLLCSSPLIQHKDWQKHQFEFTPNKAHRHITFEAWYGPGVLFKYKGNILLDDCGPIEYCERA
jgi:hypothetical protein